MHFIRCSTLFNKPLKDEPKSYSKYIYLIKEHTLTGGKRTIPTILVKACQLILEPSKWHRCEFTLLRFWIHSICWFLNLNTVRAAAKWWEWSHHVRLNQNSSWDSNGVDMLKETAGFVLL